MSIFLLFGYFSNNVVIVSSHGQRHRQQLSAHTGLEKTLVLDYDKSKNRFLCTVIYCSTSNSHAIYVRIHGDSRHDVLTFYVYYCYTFIISSPDDTAMLLLSLI
jgi:hypothetical protein